MLTVLGIDVSPGLLERWVDWLHPMSNRSS